jgi:hypothetical protein
MARRTSSSRESPAGGATTTAEQGVHAAALAGSGARRPRGQRCVRRRRDRRPQPIGLRAFRAGCGAWSCVLFICQDDDQRETFLDVAERELTGHLWHPSDDTLHHEYTGRNRLFFASEVDVHAGNPVLGAHHGFRLGTPAAPQAERRRVRLAGAAGAATAAAQRLNAVAATGKLRGVVAHHALRTPTLIADALHHACRRFTRPAAQLKERATPLSDDRA